MTPILHIQIMVFLIHRFAGSFCWRDKCWEQGWSPWTTFQVFVLGKWMSPNGNWPNHPLHLSFFFYGNECWKLSKIQSQLGSDKYEMKGHMVIKPFTVQWKKQSWLTQELEKPSISLSGGCSDPWCGHCKRQGPLVKIHNSASLLQSCLNRWLFKSHICKSKPLFSTHLHPLWSMDWSQLVNSFQEPF